MEAHGEVKSSKPGVTKEIQEIRWEVDGACPGLFFHDNQQNSKIPAKMAFVPEQRWGKPFCSWASLHTENGHIIKESAQCCS